MRRVRKGQYGFPVITISPKEYLDKGAEVILKALEPVGKAVTKFAVAPLHGATSYATTGLYRTKEKAKELRLKEKAFEEHIGPALSPSNHVVAWTQGSWNPKVGQLKIAEWGPLALLGSLGVDAIGFKYIPKGVKATAKGTKATVTKAVRNSKAKEVSKTIDKVVDEGFKPRLSSDKNLYRTTTDKEVSALKSGRFEVHPNGGNHGVYGWRRGEPFYQPGSMVESKMVGKRNGLTGVKDPTYLVAPVKEDLQVRIGSGGKYGEPVPATEVESGTHAYYHPSGGLAYDNSSIGFLPGDKLPNGIVAWSKKNGKWLFEPIEQPKQIYRARVYKGGNVTDPYSNFVTTDSRYASQYGPTTSYIFESKNPAFAREPMMGYRDPVSLDMFIYNNTKANPTADAIIGHDAVTGEFPYRSLGVEILNLNPRNLTRATKQGRVISKGTYPWYRGKQYSVKEVVNPDGTVNPRQAMRILHEVSELFPGSYKMEHRLENPEWHTTDPTTYDHTKNVALSAWGLDVPYGFTKHDLMVAALGHDFGKIVAGDGHAQIGADLAKQVFPDLTDAQYTAIAEHMGTPKTSLGKATKVADIDNGKSVIRRSEDAGNEINISPQELFKALRELEGYYFLGHGTGRTGVNPLTIFDNGLRVKGGDITNTTMPLSESNLVSWPHMNSEEIIIMPGKAAMTKYDSAHGHIPSDWYSDKVFHWTDNPKKVGSGPFAAFEPNASFTEQTIGGVPGIYTKPEAVLGSYNTKTHTLRLNPNSQYKFTFKPLNKLSLVYAEKRSPEYSQFVRDLGEKYKKGKARIEDYNESEGIKFPIGFTPIFKMWPGKVLRAHGRETIRRMEPYIDVDKTIGELPIVGKGSIREIITKNSEIPSYIGYFDKSGTLGAYNVRTGRTVVDPSRANKTVTAMQHERNMHGTERLLTPEMWKPYEELLESNFNNNIYAEAFPNGKIHYMTYDKNNVKIPISKDALKKEELRTTLGEYRKLLYDNDAYYAAEMDGALPVREDLETLRPYFEALVDNLTLPKVRKDLSSINNYGRAYANTAHNNPKFLDLVKNILKYSPAAVPFVFPWMVDKKKKGGKTHKPFGHRSVLDNGWQSTKLLKNKKNVYGK